MNTTDPKQCSARVPEGGFWGRMHNCRRPVKVERDGKPYCSIHDPENVAKRHAASEAKWKAQQKAERPRWYVNEMLALLVESQTSIGGDWTERRDALIAKLNED